MLVLVMCDYMVLSDDCMKIIYMTLWFMIRFYDMILKEWYDWMNDGLYGDMLWNDNPYDATKYPKKMIVSELYRNLPINWVR